MSDQERQTEDLAAAETADPEAFTTPAARMAAYIRGGGIIVPLITAVLAFVIAGLVVWITGHNPLATYKAIFNGTGLNWFFPWVSGSERQTAALNLQQTLIATTPLILVGLAVAFAFRAGLFNIGGQGQYLVGSIVRGLLRLEVRRHAARAAHRAGARARLRSAARSGPASPGC